MKIFNDLNRGDVFYWVSAPDILYKKVEIFNFGSGEASTEFGYTGFGGLTENCVFKTGQNTETGYHTHKNTDMVEVKNENT